MVVIRSLFPDIKIPVTDVYSYIFKEPNHPANWPALIDAATGTVVTYGQLRERIGALAAGFRRVLGVRKGSVVGVFAPNNIDYATVVYATLGLGASVTLANPTYTSDELAYQLRDAGATSLVTAAALLDIALPAVKAVPAIKHVYIFGDAPATGPSGAKIAPISDLLRHGTVTLPAVKLTQKEIQNDPAYLCYSSGTTGRSKGVETTHYNMVANVAQIEAFETNFTVGTETLMGVLPFYHIYGLNILLTFALRKGAALVIHQKFDFPAFLSSMQQYKVTRAHIVPPIALALVKSPLVDNYDVSSCKMYLSGAAPLGEELSEEFAKRFGIQIRQGYGMTELSPVTHMSLQDVIIPGSVGHLLPNVECKLVNPDTGKEVGYNQEGEVWVRGPMVMKGYHNNPQATKETIDKDGWLHTGDIGVCDETGNFKIVDRLKELIKYKGLQVAPAELEAHLLSHPSIADAAVVSIPDQAAGELPLAYVVLKPDVTLSETEVQKFIEGQVAQHKRLRGGVIFTDAIPKAASGKILRRVLREDVKGRLAKGSLKAKL
ncbi:hypothetical protein BJ742DRAFT_195424 [Cladochytrium replicatum]|nr:hypothetical protein BJ742DRAFT_195424 [Cladochytrium replicatum]